jgi:hypothetical protein
MDSPPKTDWKSLLWTFNLALNVSTTIHYLTAGKDVFFPAFLAVISLIALACSIQLNRSERT